MGTRGFTGFVVDGTEKIAYQQFDSYPDGVGLAVLRWLRAARDDESAMAAAIRGIRLVSNDDVPSDEDVQRLSRFTDLGVSTQSSRDWYCLLRETQGRPALMIAAGVMQDASDFVCDSLFCEWGYLIDVDTRTFEVYRGFQERKHANGRFASRTPRSQSGVASVTAVSYYPVALARSWSFDGLPQDDEFTAALCGDDEE